MAVLSHLQGRELSVESIKRSCRCATWLTRAQDIQFEKHSSLNSGNRALDGPKEVVRQEHKSPRGRCIVTAQLQMNGKACMELVVEPTGVLVAFCSRETSQRSQQRKWLKSIDPLHFSTLLINNNRDSSDSRRARASFSYKTAWMTTRAAVWYTEGR